MRPPLCICNGVIRSGSTWSFNVCRGLMRELGRQLNVPAGSTYFDDYQLDAFIAQQWHRAPGATVVKAHQMGPFATNAVRTGLAKAVCTYRDPRDCVASDLVFMGQGMDIAIKRVAGTLDLIRHYQNNNHILLVRYEEMMADRLGQIRRMAAHLGVSVEEKTVREIDANTDIESAKKRCSTLKDKPLDSVLHIALHRVDPETHLHESHISNAKIGRWKDELTAAHGRYLTEYFSSWLIRLGYETPASVQRILNKPDYAQPLPAGYGTFTVGAGLKQPGLSA